MFRSGVGALEQVVLNVVLIELTYKSLAECFLEILLAGKKKYELSFSTLT